MVQNSSIPVVCSRVARAIAACLMLAFAVAPLGARAQTAWFTQGASLWGSYPSVPPRAQVSITFDDGWASQYDAALPVLNAYGVRATFYITTAYLDHEEYPGFMTAEQVRSLARAGHEIGGHTVTHRDLTTLRAGDLLRELSSSKRTLERVTGTRVTSLAYPFGSYNQAVLRTARLTGYTNGRTVEPETNSAATPVFELRSLSPTSATPLTDLLTAVDDAVARGEWLIITFHEMADNGNEYANTPAYLDALLAHTTALGVPVVTVRQGLAGKI